MATKSAFVVLVGGLVACLFSLKFIEFWGYAFQLGTEEIRGQCLRYNIDEQKLEKTPFVKHCLKRKMGKSTPFIYFDIVIGLGEYGRQFL